MPPDVPPTCPECGRPMTFAGFLLSLREDDGKRACRGGWKCGAGHVWWNWADRPDEPVERCPHPQLFRG
ncbi:dehydrogenase [Streptomyces sp. NBC_01465]|uniref:dehydrogenase n=1 Tax=Streptomyces sp. NBC_01465 TaxID=2903878 RepID=UPI002E3530E3|nr:dehydrogenase [Streptomyces sp. NBC_01465]